MVVERRNSQASVYSRFSLHALSKPKPGEYVSSIDTLKEDAQILNEIAKLFLENDEETEAMRGHFAVEIMKNIRGSSPPIPFFCTPIVKGFTLQEYAENTGKYAAELPPELLGSEIQKLKKALEWLIKKGFVHGDIKPENVIWDKVNKKLVLFDFETAAVADEGTIEDDLSCFRDLIEPLADEHE